MDARTFSLVENYMLSCAGDSAHDKEHIYRVLYTAMEIAETEKDVDYDVLICSCLLHDIGRLGQFQNSGLNHAVAGGDKAYSFLTGHGFSKTFSEKVKECIQAHSYRADNPPQSLEAKILFDSDKIDAAGASGMARSLIYSGQVGRPLYSLLPDGMVSDGTNDEAPSFFQEYKYKLEKLYDRFYTRRGAEIARERQSAAVQFYNSLFCEMCRPYEIGAGLLNHHIKNAP